MENALVAIRRCAYVIIYFRRIFLYGVLIVTNAYFSEDVIVTNYVRPGIHVVTSLDF